MELTPLPVFGVEVRGIDLKQDQPTEIIQRIKQNVYKYRIVQVFLRTTKQKGIMVTKVK